MTDPLALINTRRTDQAEQADPREVRNHAGGYVHALDGLAQLRRFLVTGSQGGSYYVGAPELTKQNAGVLLGLVRTRGVDVVAEVLAVSVAGRAPKQQPALFALAACAGAGDGDTRRAALAALPQVARTASHLFTFTKYVEQFRGWGRLLRTAVADWYLDKPVSDLAYQLVKYRQREGWSHRDVLRVAHPKIPQIVNEAGDRVDVDADAPARRALFGWAAGHLPAGVATTVPTGHPELRIVEGFERAQSSGDPGLTARLVTEYGLSWEMLPTEHLTSPHVWAALLDRGMPQTALMRNLPRLTELGLLTRRSLHLARVVNQLSTGMAKAKVHPVNVLIAQRTYAGGHSLRGSSTWTPVPQVTDALDAGFYEAFGGVEPSGKRTLLALDVSGSMGYTNIDGLPITPREVSAAIAMVTVATEPDVTVVGFTDGGRGRYPSWGARGYGPQAALTELDLSPRRRLDDVIRSISNLPFGGTDCALPWTWALEQGLEFDTVATYTDNETWAGPIHVDQAARRYRQRTGIAARSIVVGMTATPFTLNSPDDELGLDVAGFDSATPQLISDFSAGRI